MDLKISSLVRGVSKERIKQGFTRDLFLSLNPPFPRVNLFQFDGCKTGDQVGLELNFIFFKQKWISKIIEDNEDDRVWYFIDQGTTLPFFLKSWKHRHIVEESKSDSFIIDQISYSSGFWIIDIILYPVLLLQFLYRKPIYRKWFERERKN